MVSRFTETAFTLKGEETEREEGGDSGPLESTIVERDSQGGMRVLGV
jgi:hypothetical protein